MSGHNDDRSFRLARTLVEKHVDEDVAAIVLEAFDEWHDELETVRNAAARAWVADGDGYVSVRQIVERWSCSDEHVRRLIADAHLPATRLGNLVRIPLAAVVSYEEDRIVRAVPKRVNTTRRRTAQQRVDDDVLEQYPWLSS